MICIDTIRVHRSRTGDALVHFHRSRGICILACGKNINLVLFDAYRKENNHFYCDHYKIFNIIFKIHINKFLGKVSQFGLKYILEIATWNSKNIAILKNRGLFLLIAILVRELRID